MRISNFTKQADSLLLFQFAIYFVKYLIIPDSLLRSQPFLATIEENKRKINMPSDLPAYQKIGWTGTHSHP